MSSVVRGFAAYALILQLTPGVRVFSVSACWQTKNRAKIDEFMNLFHVDGHGECASHRVP